MWKRFMITLMVLALTLVACGDGGEGRPEEQLPWSEDFTDPQSGWQVESDASAQVDYQDGAMRVLIEAPNRLAWASAGREYADFQLTVEAEQVAGPNDNEYGVLVRMEDADHFYRFSISGDGYYQIAKYDGESWEELTGDWQPSEAIKQGAATNRLVVICQATTMTFLVNDETVVQVEDETYRRGDIGLYAGTFFEPGVEIHFDNLEVTAPTP